MTDTEKKWTEIAKMLKGRTIVGVRYMSEEEAEGPIALTLWFTCCAS